MNREVIVTVSFGLFLTEETRKYKIFTNESLHEITEAVKQRTILPPQADNIVWSSYYLTDKNRSWHVTSFVGWWVVLDFLNRNQEKMEKVQVICTGRNPHNVEILSVLYHAEQKLG